MARHTDRPSEDDLLEYLSGRMSGSKAAEIESAVQADPHLAAEIALMRSAREALAAGSSDTSPGALGWARLERAIDGEAVHTASSAQPRTWLIAASVAVAAVAVWQVVAVPILTGTGEGYVTATGETEADLPTATVAFAPGATEDSIRALLGETGAQITAGPSAIGLWQLSFETEAARDAAIERFATAREIIESIQAD